MRFNPALRGLIRIQVPSWDACHRLMTTALMESQGTGLTNPALEVTAMLHHTGGRGVPG